MTIKPTISLPDQAYAFARSMVDCGRFASLSAVVQHGLRLLERDEAEHRLRLDALRADLARRAAQPSITAEAMDDRLVAWRAERDGEALADLA